MVKPLEFLQQLVGSKVTGLVVNCLHNRKMFTQFVHNPLFEDKTFVFHNKLCVCPSGIVLAALRGPSFTNLLLMNNEKTGVF